MKSNKRQDNWTQFWENENKSSCGSGIESSSSEVNAFWENCSAVLNKGDRVLDLCCGKGGVFDKLIENISNREGNLPHFIGVDLSEISTDIFMERFRAIENNVEFYPSTSIEELPLGEEDVSVVTSQFGLEYSLNKRTYQEIFRVLEKSGQIYLIMHHHESILVKVSKVEIEHVNYLQNESSFFDTLKGLIPFFSQLRNPANKAKLNKNEDALNMRNKFNQETEVLLSMVANSRCPEVIREALQMSQIVLNIAKESGTGKANKALKKYQSDLEDSKLRSKELIEFAMTRDAVDRMIGSMNSIANVDASIEELHSEEELVAWGLILKRKD